MKILLLACKHIFPHQKLLQLSHAVVYAITFEADEKGKIALSSKLLVLLKIFHCTYIIVLYLSIKRSFFKKGITDYSVTTSKGICH